MPVIKNKTTVENAAFWSHVEAIAQAVRARNQASGHREISVPSAPRADGYHVADAGIVNSSPKIENR